jgi:hypothetical protein
LEARRSFRSEFPLPAFAGTSLAGMTGSGVTASKEKSAEYLDL